MSGHWFITIFSLVVLTTQSCKRNGQQTPYEQKALYFLMDSIIPKDTSLQKLRIYFNDSTTSYRTSLDSDMLDHFFSQEEIKYRYKFCEDTTSEIYLGHFYVGPKRLLMKQGLTKGRLPSDYVFDKDFELYVSHFSRLKDNYIVELNLRNEDWGIGIFLIMDEDASIRQKKITRYDI